MAFIKCSLKSFIKTLSSRMVDASGNPRSGAYCPSGSHLWSKEKPARARSFGRSRGQKLVQNKIHYKLQLLAQCYNQLFSIAKTQIIRIQKRLASFCHRSKNPIRHNCKQFDSYCVQITARLRTRDLGLT